MCFVTLKENNLYDVQKQSIMYSWGGQRVNLGAEYSGLRLS